MEVLMELDMHTIGLRIKNRRKELQLTQTDIKKTVGISSGNLSDIENGNRLPAAPTLVQLANVLECSIDWILTGISPLSERCVSPSIGDPMENTLLNNFRELSKEDKTEALMENMIGQRIKNRRRELKITQTQIQQETSISSGNLSCIENGKYLPSAIALLELSKILDCSIDWILTGKSSISESQTILETREETLLNGFRMLPEDEQKELIEILEMKLRKYISQERTHPNHTL